MRHLPEWLLAVSLMLFLGLGTGTADAQGDDERFNCRQFLQDVREAGEPALSGDIELKTSSGGMVPTVSDLFSFNEVAIKEGAFHIFDRSNSGRSQSDQPRCVLLAASLFQTGNPSEVFQIDDPNSPLERASILPILIVIQENTEKSISKLDSWLDGTGDSNRLNVTVRKSNLGNAKTRALITDGEYSIAGQSFKNTADGTYVTGLNIGEFYNGNLPRWWRKIEDLTRDRNESWSLSRKMLVLCPSAPCEKMIETSAERQPREQPLPLEAGEDSLLEFAATLDVIVAPSRPATSVNNVPAQPLQDIFVLEVVYRESDEGGVADLPIPMKGNNAVTENEQACLLYFILDREVPAGLNCSDIKERLKSAKIKPSAPNKIIIDVSATGSGGSRVAGARTQHEFRILMPPGANFSSCDLRLEEVQSEAATNSISDAGGGSNREIIAEPRPADGYYLSRDEGLVPDTGTNMAVRINVNSPRACGGVGRIVTVNASEASDDVKEGAISIPLAPDQSKYPEVVFLPLFNTSDTDRVFGSGAARRVWAGAMLAAIESAHRRLAADERDIPWRIAGTRAIAHDLNDRHEVFRLPTTDLQSSAAVREAFPASLSVDLNNLAESPFAINAETVSGHVKQALGEAPEPRPLIVVLMGGSPNRSAVCGDLAMKRVAEAFREQLPDRVPYVIWLPIVRANDAFGPNSADEFDLTRLVQSSHELLACRETAPGLRVVPFLSQPWYDYREIANRYSVSVGDYLGDLLERIALGDEGLGG